MMMIFFVLAKKTLYKKYYLNKQCEFMQIKDSRCRTENIPKISENNMKIDSSRHKSIIYGLITGRIHVSNSVSTIGPRNEGLQSKCR